MSSASPTAMSMKYLRDLGYSVHRVEYWNAFSRKRVDAYGFGDLLTASASDGIALIQVATSSNMQARVSKILKLRQMEAKRWLCAGGKIWVHGWGKRGARGKRKTWQLFRHEITLGSFEPK